MALPDLFHLGANDTHLMEKNLCGVANLYIILIYLNISIIL